MIFRVEPGRSPRDDVITALNALDEAFRDDFSMVPGRGAAELTAKVAVLADGLRVALSTLAASVGECQVEVPYAAIQLVRLPDGTRQWCCAHDSPHCDPA